MDGFAAKRIEKRETQSSLFGELLRNWRKMRNVSQLELALAAEVSQRHVSFLESGRSKPSKDMALALAEQLDMPLRARNELLAAAGYAAFYAERSLDSAALAPTVAILKRMLEHHEPFPAFVLDAGWNIVMVNQAADRLLGAYIVPGANPQDRVQANFLEIMCDPNRLRPFVRSWPRTGSALLARLRREAAANPGSPSERLLRELLAKNAFPPFSVSEEPDPTIPIELQFGERRLRLVTTTTIFGAPQDVALQELRIEMSFPADEESEALLRSWKG